MNFAGSCNALKRFHSALFSLWGLLWAVSIGTVALPKKQFKYTVEFDVFRWKLLQSLLPKTAIYSQIFCRVFVEQVTKRLLLYKWTCKQNETKANIQLLSSFKLHWEFSIRLFERNKWSSSSQALSKRVVWDIF